MALLALGAVTIVAMVAFIRSDRHANKAATAVMWAVMALWSFSGGL